MRWRYLDEKFQFQCLSPNYLFMTEWIRKRTSFLPSISNRTLWPNSSTEKWAEYQRKIIQLKSQNGFFLFSIYFSFFAKRILVFFSSFVFVFLVHFIESGWLVSMLLIPLPFLFVCWFSFDQIYIYIFIFFYLQHFILSLFAAARATFLSLCCFGILRSAFAQNTKQYRNWVEITYM